MKLHKDHELYFNSFVEYIQNTPDRVKTILKAEYPEMSFNLVDGRTSYSKKAEERAFKIMLHEAINYKHDKIKHMLYLISNKNEHIREYYFIPNNTSVITKDTLKRNLALFIHMPTDIFDKELTDIALFEEYIKYASRLGVAKLYDITEFKSVVNIVKICATCNKCK